MQFKVSFFLLPLILFYNIPLCFSVYARVLSELRMDDFSTLRELMKISISTSMRHENSEILERI